MIGNSLETFSEDVFQFVTGETKKFPESGKSLLVKKHTENLNTVGDYSFPNTVKSWHGFLNLEQNSDGAENNLMVCIGKEPENLVEESKKWRLKIQKAVEMNGRVHMFLSRAQALQIGLYEAIKNIIFIPHKMHDKNVCVVSDPLCDDNKSITFLRLQYLSKSIQNLQALSAKNKRKVFVTAKSSSKCDGSDIILCGTVLNAKTGVKETRITADDFIRIRQKEMSLIAQHKYGFRVTGDSKWKEFIIHMGESAAIFELLQCKPSSAVKINFNSSLTGSSKGAAFILYNIARLETIIRTFNARVEKGVYPEPPNIRFTEFTLLTHEDEWTLTFNYILYLPTLLTNCVDSDNRSEFRPHLVCGFLCSMVRVFSQYYRKVKILTEPREHLMPVLYARIQLLRVLNDTLKVCLKILNIKSVSQM